MNNLRKIFAALKAGLEATSQYIKSHDGQSSLQPLTPVLLDGKEIEKYERELLAALNPKKQPKTRNIAVTGAYGAGKSSFLHSFAARNKTFKYSYISLARLDSLDNAEEGQKSTKEIEESIVQQLLYSTSSADLPETRFQRIKHPSHLRSITHTLLTITFLISLIYLYSEKYSSVITNSKLVIFIKPVFVSLVHNL